MWWMYAVAHVICYVLYIGVVKLILKWDNEKSNMFLDDHLALGMAFVFSPVALLGALVVIFFYCFSYCSKGLLYINKGIGGLFEKKEKVLKKDHGTIKFPS